jgi:tetratricopeptide (TPR) repeat protein
MMAWKNCLAAFVILCSLSAAAAGKPQTRDALVQRAEALQGQGDYDGAAALWNDVLKTDPSDVQALATLGLLSSKQQKYSEAEGFYRRALILLPDNPELLLNLALAYFKSSDLKQATPIFEKVVKLQPENQQARTLLGISYYGLGDFQNAIPLLEQSPERATDSMRQMLAQAYLQRKQLDKAEKELTELVRNNPDSAPVHVLLAEALDASGRTDSAIEQFKAALKLAESDPNVHFGLGYLYWKRRDDSSAEFEFRRVLQIDPANAHAMTYLADIELRKGQPEEAEKRLVKAIGLQDNIYLAHLDMGAVLQKQGKHAEAIQEFRKAAVLDPQRGEAHYRMATSYRAVGSVAEAAEQLRIAESLHDKDLEDDAHKSKGSVREQAPPDIPKK